MLRAPFEKRYSKCGQTTEQSRRWPVPKLIDDSAQGAQKGDALQTWAVDKEIPE